MIATETLPTTTSVQEASCECMVCDLPPGAPHGPVAWRLALWFPGPFPHEGETAMLLCEHCKADWVDGDWSPPYDNFIIIQLTRI